MKRMHEMQTSNARGLRPEEIRSLRKLLKDSRGTGAPATR